MIKFRARLIFAENRAAKINPVQNLIHLRHRTKAGSKMLSVTDLSLQLCLYAGENGISTIHASYQWDVLSFVHH